MRSLDNSFCAMNDKHVRVGLFRHIGVDGFRIDFLKSGKEDNIYSDCVDTCLADIPIRYHKKISNVIGRIMASVPKDEMPPVFKEGYDKILKFLGIKRPRRFKPGDCHIRCDRPIVARLERGCSDYNISISQPEKSESIDTDAYLFFSIVEHCARLLSNKELAEIQKQCKDDLVNHPDATAIYDELCEVMKKRGVPLA